MEKVLLTGESLTIGQVADVAKRGAQVEIAPEAWRRICDSRQLVFDLVDADYPIYGFNVGVGWNKDKKVFKEFFEQYNTNLIRSHCVGLPPYADDADVRAAMLARMNTMLTGCCGISPEIPRIYADMLNNGIHPLVPLKGSVGEADIGLISHVGLAIIGEGNVRVNGEVMPSLEAFERFGLKKLALGPKDGLAIASSNSMASGPGALVLDEIEEFLDVSELVYALSLEGLNGNTTPLDDRTHAVRKFTGQREVARRLRGLLEGSFIYEPDEEKAVQDPLSYRSFAQVHGAVREMLAYARERLEIQLNSTDDNPCVLLEDRVILSCANFEPLNWVIAIEGLAIALSHASKSACQRIIKLADPTFTKLPRFLSPAVEVLGFATVQKTYVALDAEIRHLCNPCSMDGMSLAGDMEDTSTNAPYIVQNLRAILENLRGIFALELMHAVQAMEYRKERPFGKGTKPAFEKVRSVMPFYDKDRNITEDILTLRGLLTNGELAAIARSESAEG